MSASRHLLLDDIEDLRRYERTREEYRRRIIELKRRRRVSVGPIVTLVFENRETVRFQVQEMARAERMTTDAAIQTELDVYNSLIPGPGELSATVFIELTDTESLHHWLPRLVGVERALELRIGGPAPGGGDVPPGMDVVRSVPDEGHEEALTRPGTTASVHYVRFVLSPPQVQRFAAGPVVVAVAHPGYEAETLLSDEVRTELLTDLTG